MTDCHSSGPNCSLEAHALQERVASIASLNQKYLRRAAREGRALTLTYDAAARREVEEMVEKERECCAFLEFGFQSGPDVELTITVPADAADRADQLLAPFNSPQPGAGASDCCGACDPTPPVKARGAAGAAAATATTAVLACGACCVIPLAFPAVAATAAGSVLALMGRAHVWMTALAVLVVVAAWLWIWRQSSRRKARPATSTVSLMSVASLATMLALAWPQLEPSVMAALAP